MIFYILNDVGTRRAFDFFMGHYGKKVIQGQRQQKYPVCHVRFFVNKIGMNLFVANGSLYQNLKGTL